MLTWRGERVDDMDDAWKICRIKAKDDGDLLPQRVTREKVGNCLAIG